jgi:recombination protein RecA
MGRKKKDQDDGQNQATVATSTSVIDEIIDKYGEVVKDGTDIVALKPIIIPISPAIDIGLGGGIPEGSFVILTGPPKGGKTTLANWIAANAQKHYDPSLCPNGRNIYFFGVEGRLKPRDLQGIPHLDLTKFKQIVSSPGNILSAEKFLDSADLAIRNDPGCIVIIDSFSALCTEAESLGSMSDQQRADGAKLLAKFCRKVANVIPINKCIVIGITHIMSNPGYGNPTQEKSGNALKYQADVKLRIKKFEFIKLSETGNPVGQEVHWTVEFSAIGAPGADITSYITYGKGIDESKELVTLGEDLGIIHKAASWYSFNDTAQYGDTKYQGKQSITDAVEKDANIKKLLQAEVYKVCGLTQ